MVNKRARRRAKREGNKFALSKMPQNESTKPLTLVCRIYSDQNDVGFIINAPPGRGKTWFLQHKMQELLGDRYACTTKTHKALLQLKKTGLNCRVFSSILSMYRSREQNLSEACKYKVMVVDEYSMLTMMTWSFCAS